MVPRKPVCSSSFTWEIGYYSLCLQKPYLSFCKISFLWITWSSGSWYLKKNFKNKKSYFPPQKPTFICQMSFVLQIIMICYEFTYLIQQNNWLLCFKLYLNIVGTEKVCCHLLCRRVVGGRHRGWNPWGIPKYYLAFVT